MRKVLLGLSGGIDSAVSAAVLLKAGYEVTGCFLFLGEKTAENSPEADFARQTALRLGIDFITADFRESFREKVCCRFMKEYLAGLTPNPCIRCNSEVKFAGLFKCAEKIGADCVATGHYALTGFSAQYGGTVLRAAKSKKDQSYFLYTLPTDMLEKIIFPLGGFSCKDEVRKYGAREGLPNCSKPDSRDICFIPGGNYAEYILKNAGVPPAKGNFLDCNGNILGTHDGIINYTVGQRRGLGAFGERMYVKRINAADNTVTLCRENERFSRSLRLRDMFKTVRNAPSGEFTALVKVRSTAAAEPARVFVDENGARVDFYKGVNAPAPGQSAVIYAGDTVLGGGIIV